MRTTACSVFCLCFLLSGVVAAGELSLVKISRGKHVSYKIMPKESVPGFQNELKAEAAKIKELIDQRKADFKKEKIKTKYRAKVPSTAKAKIVYSNESEEKVAAKLASTEQKALDKAAVTKLKCAQLKDTLLDTEASATPKGQEPRSLPLRQIHRNPTSLFLLKPAVDIKKAIRGKKIIKAELTIKVWDPCQGCDAKFIILPVLTKWQEETACWDKPSPDGKWVCGDGFTIGWDTGIREAPAATVVLKKDDKNDTIDPPAAYTVDITGLVMDWAAGKLPNEGLALIPSHDEEMNEGKATRVQILAREYRDESHGPCITIYHSK